jgi:hypothetical protein
VGHLAIAVGLLRLAPTAALLDGSWSFLLPEDHLMEDPQQSSLSPTATDDPAPVGGEPESAPPRIVLYQVLLIDLLFALQSACSVWSVKG